MIVQHLLKDPILIVLLIASLIAWILIIDRLLTFQHTAVADKAFLAGTATADAPLAQLQATFDAYAGTSGEHLLTVMDTAIMQQRQQLERALPVIGVIGSTAPYAGLLGTVIGIIQAFQSIQMHNNMSPSVVSGGIATALIATAIGLGVAIPAVVAHHLFSAAIARRVANWEAVVATWLPATSEEEQHHEPLPIA